MRDSNQSQALESMSCPLFFREGSAVLEISKRWDAICPNFWINLDFIYF